MLGRWDALLGILNCASVCYDLLKTINFGEEREIGSKLLKNEVFIIPENNKRPSRETKSLIQTSVFEQVVTLRGKCTIAEPLF